MCKILNIGSINIDYVYSIPHFVKAGETLSCTGRQVFPGGKGLNQSVALARAGGRVFHAGRIGPEGGEMLALLQATGVDTAQVHQGAAPTGHAIIQVDEAGQNCILLYAGANCELREEQVDAAMACFGKNDILVLQNETNLLAYSMRKAYERGMRIAFNPSPYHESIRHLPLEYVHWFILNEVEGAAITGSHDPKEILLRLRAQYPGAAAVLTLGERGAYCQTEHQTVYQKAYPIPVVDTTAAGDTFTGFFLCAAAAGKPVDEALRLAAMGAALAVSRQGAAVSIPTWEEVQAASFAS